MAKMTKEEKAAKAAEKKAAQKAKKEAKRLAKLEKKRQRAEKKRAKREAEKAKKIEKREKERAKRAKIREQKRLAREKRKAMKLAQKLKMKKAGKTLTKDVIDIRAAAKDMKRALAQIAVEMAQFDDAKRIKKAKSICGMGYDVENDNGTIIVRFVAEKSKKTKLITKVEEPKKVAAEVVEKPSEPIEEPNEVEIVPAGDLYGQDGNASGEVANIDNEDDELDVDDEDGNEENDYMADSRDEQDDDLVESRREFFNNFGEDFEPNDD